MAQDEPTLESLISGSVSLGSEGSLMDSLSGVSGSKTENVNMQTGELFTDEPVVEAEKPKADEKQSDVVEDTYVEQEINQGSVVMGASLLAGIRSRATSQGTTPSAPVAPSTPSVAPAASSPTAVASQPVSGAPTPSVVGGGGSLMDSLDEGTKVESETSSIFMDDEDDSESFGKSQAGIVAEDASDDAEPVVTPEDRFEWYSNRVLGAVLHDGEVGRSRRKWLFSQITPDLFRDENHLIYTALYRKREDLINLGSEYLRMYLKDNMGILKRAGKVIDLGAYDSIDGSQELGYIEGTVKHLDYLTGLEQIDEDDFRRDFETYLLYYKSIELARTYADSMEILQDGMKGGKGGLMAGSFDSVDFVRRRIATIEGATDRKNGTGFVSLKDYIENPEESVKPFKVSDYDTIDELNNHYGGVMSGQLITIVGPPKGGKSKICARIAHRALTAYGNNVSVWPIEGGNDLFSAQLRAIHFDDYYNDPTKVSRDQMRFGVDQETIAYDKWAKFERGDEMRAMELQSASDLVNNVSYGNVHLIDRQFNVETFIDEIDTSVKSNMSNIVVIDYMQMITSAQSKSRREAIQEAYPKLLEYAHKHNITIISPAQYHQSAVDDLNKGIEVDPRTAVAESSEIVRSSDLVIQMYGTVEELRNNRLRFMSVPSRFAQPFDPFTVDIDLGRCKFTSFAKEG